MIKIGKAKVNEREEELADLEKELEAKVLDARHTTAENEELLKKLDTQVMSVGDIERMHREMLWIENEIARSENKKSSLEDECWDLDSKLVTKLESLDGLVEQCNNALKGTSVP